VRGKTIANRKPVAGDVGLRFVIALPRGGGYAAGRRSVIRVIRVIRVIEVDPIR
jgi:hypothetical protein